MGQGLGWRGGSCQGPAIRVEEELEELGERGGNLNDLNDLNHLDDLNDSNELNHLFLTPCALGRYFVPMCF